MDPFSKSVALSSMPSFSQVVLSKQQFKRLQEQQASSRLSPHEIDFSVVFFKLVYDIARVVNDAEINDISLYQRVSTNVSS